MENKDKVFKVKVLLETDCNACDAADCPVRAKLPVEHASLAADAADQVAAHLSLLMETLLDGDEAEWLVNTLMFFKEEDESRTAIDNNLFRDSDFVDIFTFFVINSPCSTLSRRRISLYDYGWNTPWRKPFSLRRQLQRASSNYKLLHSADNVDSVEAALEKASLDDENWTNANMESICVYDCEGNQFLSVFYHIRNSLAHGRFNIFQEDEDWIFYMEDARGLRRREKWLS